MEEDNELTAVIKVIIKGVEYLVPIDNWNKAITEQRTKPIILGDELHFVTQEDWNKIESAIWIANLTDDKNDD